MATCASCRASLPAGARFCPACAHPVAEPTALGEERKLATVLFADLVDSTELADAEDPERTRAMLSRFYDAMAGEVIDGGGTVDKFMGDAVMAVFGAPTAQEDHAERALHAALSMLRRLEQVFGGTLSLRIGVNTGDVIVGNLRESSSFVTGDAVNVAARLEAAARPGEILIGVRTVAAVGEAFEVGEPVSVEAKGKAGGVVCHRLIRGLSPIRPRGISGLRHFFVGREHEIEALERAYGRVVEEAQPRLVTIIGEAGVGKTTLTREFSRRLGSRSPEPLRRVGRCSALGTAIAYKPLGDIVREHFGLLQSDSVESVRDRLGRHEILGLTLGMEAPAGLASAGGSGSAAPGVGRLPGGPRRGATRGRARRGPALGRGGPPQPAGSRPAGRPRAAAPPRHGATGGSFTIARPGVGVAAMPRPFGWRRCPPLTRLV